MKTHLLAILSLIATCSHLQAEPSTLGWDYGYQYLREETDPMYQNVMSIFCQLHPQHEREEWDITYEARSADTVRIDWDHFYEHRYTEVSVYCSDNPHYRYSYRKDYIDENGDQHLFTALNANQRLHEVVSKNGPTIISLETVFSNMFYIITVKAEEGKYGLHNANGWQDLFREKWIQLFLSIQFPEQMTLNQIENATNPQL